MGGQIDQMRNRLGRAADPANARSGHGMPLGHGADDQGALCHAGQSTGALVAALPDLAVIDLVRDQPEIRLPAQPGDTGQRFGAVDRAGGVVGRVDQERGRAIGLCRDIGGAGLKRVLGPGRDGDRNRACAPDRAGIGGVMGINEQGPVAGIAGGHMACKKRGLPAGSDQNVVARGGQAGLIGDPPAT